MKNNTIIINDLGLISYKEAWEFQEKLVKEIIDTKIQNRTANPQKITSNYLLFCQHPHVYTLGKSGKAQHLLANSLFLEEKKIEFIETNRGGDITYHGPGQMIVYPILDLDNFFTDIHRYIRLLEESIIQTCDYFSVVGERVKGMTGVWIEKDTTNARKIAAIGVRTSRWVTMHGLALNVSTDLSYFKYIVPCGIVDKQVTSLEKELPAAPSMEVVKKIFLQKFKTLFDANFPEK